MVTKLPLPPLSLYIHFPWCVRKCPYCDFNSHEIKSNIPERQYIDTLLADLDHDLGLLGSDRVIESIFMGGGTPSLFSAEALEKLLTGIEQRVLLTSNCEITLEANPGTIESHNFQAYRAIGINRLSMGIQSFNDHHLDKLGRIHNGKEAIAAYEIARAAGFVNINLDLMFGLPGQSAVDAREDIKMALSLAPTHISYYQLTLEPNTYFYKFPPKLPSDDDIYYIQKTSQDLLAGYGYHQYEISAYAQNGRQCKHNLNYWKFGDYLGIGAGAHGKLSVGIPGRILRTVKSKNPGLYLGDIHQLTANYIELDQLPIEYLMNQLRLKAGFSLSEYQQMTGLSRSSLEPGLAACLSQSLLLEENEHFRCSEQGWDFLDVILEKFCV